MDIKGVDEVDETKVGGVVVRRSDGNGAPRKEIILQEPSSWSGTVVLTRSYGGEGRVRVFTGPGEEATEITFAGGDNEFSTDDLPKSLYVQGHEASSSMRDVTLALSKKHEPSVKDQVKFTVLWVTVNPDHQGPVEEDNAARDNHSKLIVTEQHPDYSLGHHLFATNEHLQEQNGWSGRASEFAGEVAPSDFNPSEFGGELRLTRRVVDGKLYWGPNGNENSVVIPAHIDRSPKKYRDDDPQSGESEGVIYDLDGPGTEALGQKPLGTIRRRRVNFEEWAEYNGTQCSKRKKWYTRQSYKKTAPWDMGTASSGDVNLLRDTSKQWPANQWVPGVIKIYEGQGAGQVRHVEISTNDTIQVSEDWGVGRIPDRTSKYEVIHKSTWEVVDDVPGDNQNADSTTPTTWNLQ